MVNLTKSNTVKSSLQPTLKSERRLTPEEPYPRLKARLPRLTISRTTSVLEPPPLPLQILPHRPPLGHKEVPGWLLNNVLVKSCANTLDSHPPIGSNSEVASPQCPTSPIRAYSPSKRLPSLHRSLGSLAHTSFTSSHVTFQSASGGREADEERESYWSLFEEDRSAPHIQPRYFDRPAPNERWVDLDPDHPSSIPEPEPSSFSKSLVDVYQPASHPTRSSDLHPTPLDSFGFEAGLKLFLKMSECNLPG